MLEIGGIIVLGIAAQWLAWRMRVPAILPLILTGLFVGPLSEMIGLDRWINPIQLFGQQNLFGFVSLAIGVILFEGSLTLKMSEIRETGQSIGRLITIGALVTFVLSTLAAHYLMGIGWEISALFAALIIVTGPTVIAPILRNLSLSRNVSTVLKWEGILIDPIGAVAAVLVFKFITAAGHGHASPLHLVQELVTITIVGCCVGYAAARLLGWMIIKHFIPHYLVNVFTLALVMAAFMFSDILAHESGLLTVVVMGMALGNANIPGLKAILDFKESITVLLISILFIVLSANITTDQIDILLQNWRVLLLFLAVVFVVRPVGVFLSTIGSNLSTQEKLFISWVGPRGIVAAGIASLFGLQLMEYIDAGKLELANADMLTPLVFFIVLGTVLLNATSARIMAKVLGVELTESNGVVIIGAHKGARLIGTYLQNAGRHVVLVDNSPAKIEQAKAKGLEAFQANIYNEAIDENVELSDIGYMLVMTGNAGVDNHAMKSFGKTLGENGAYRLPSSAEVRSKKMDNRETLFSPITDESNLNMIASYYPKIHELPLESEDELREHLEKMDSDKTNIPLFMKRAGKLNIMTTDRKVLDFEEGDILVYMGRSLIEVAVETDTEAK